MEGAFVPAGLRTLPVRSGARPAVDVRYPCLQADQHSPGAIRSRLLASAAALREVTIAPTELSVPGVALVLAERLARGKPEAFVRGREFAIVRTDGSVHVNLDPHCGQLLLDASWATIHPLARYMAGVLPPQSLVVYAPRDESELRVAADVLAAAHCFAVGRVGDLILPDTAW
jgi:hypothetical protein